MTSVQATVIYRDTFGLDAGNGRVAGANLNGLPVETTSVGPANWTSRDLYQGGSFTLGSSGGANYLQPNIGHTSALATLAASLGSNKYYLEADVFSEAAGGSPGYLGIGFFRGTGGSYVWQNGLTALFLIVQTNGQYWLNGSAPGGSLMTINSGNLATAGWSANSMWHLRIDWDTTLNQVTAAINGTHFVAVDFPLAGMNILPGSVTHVGIARDQQLGPNSRADNFEFGTMPQSVPEPFTMALSVAASGIGVRRIRKRRDQTEIAKAIGRS